MINSITIVQIRSRGFISMKLVSLISGGIDSPVGTYLALKKGYEIIALHMDNIPYTDERSRVKTINIVKHLEKFSGEKIKMYIVPHGPNLTIFSQNCYKNITCVLCKRMMLRIAGAIAKIEDTQGILTGESLGQVASQTLSNLRVEELVSSVPILRPLIGLDKIEIIDIAKGIGTYDLSISPCMSCSIVPDKPATRALLEKIILEESKVDIELLVRNSIDNLKIVDTNS